MITKEAKNVIEKNPLAFATVDWTGKPNVIGIACVKAVSPNKILITDNFMKQTKENITKNRNVCLAVWNKKWKGYKLIGTASYYTKGKWKAFVEKMPENKGLSAKGAILVNVKKVIKLE